MRLGNVFYLLALLVLIGSIVYAIAFIHYGEREVLCKDSVGNKIPDSKCIEENTWKDGVLSVALGILISIFFVFNGYLINKTIKNVETLEKKIFEEFNKHE